MRFFPVPVVEAEAWFLRKRFSEKEPADLFTARMHAAMLLTSGKLAQWSLSDLAEFWGWGRNSKSRAKRVIDYVSDREHSWSLLDTELERNDFGTAAERDRNGSGTRPERPDSENQEVASTRRNGNGTAAERDRNGSGTHRARARNSKHQDPDADQESKEEEQDPEQPPGGGPDAGSSTEVPKGFPVALLDRSDLPMLVKLWKDLKRPAARKSFLEVEQVWRAYKEEFPRARLLGVKEYRKIEERLEEGKVSDPPIMIEDLCLVPKGVKLSPFHMGDNPTRTKYTQLESIYGDAKKVLAHIARAKGETEQDDSEPPIPTVATVHELPPPRRPEPPASTSVEQRQVKAALDFLGDRMIDAGCGRDEVTTQLQTLYRSFDKGVIVEAIRAWRDEPEEPGDDKSEIITWVTARCRRITHTRQAASA